VLRVNYYNDVGIVLKKNCLFNRGLLLGQLIHMPGHDILDAVY